MKYTVEQFAQQIKAKYPAYKDWDDNYLVKQVVTKYPEYRSWVAFPSETLQGWTSPEEERQKRAAELRTTPTGKAFITQTPETAKVPPFIKLEWQKQKQLFKSKAYSLAVPALKISRDIWAAIAGLGEVPTYILSAGYATPETIAAKLRPETIEEFKKADISKLPLRAVGGMLSFVGLINLGEGAVAGTLAKTGLAARIVPAMNRVLTTIGGGFIAGYLAHPRAKQSDKIKYGLNTAAINLGFHAAGEALSTIHNKILQSQAASEAWRELENKITGKFVEAGMPDSSAKEHAKWTIKVMKEDPEAFKAWMQGKYKAAPPEGKPEIKKTIEKMNILEGKTVTLKTGKISKKPADILWNKTKTRVEGIAENKKMLFTEKQQRIANEIAKNMKVAEIDPLTAEKIRAGYVAIQQPSKEIKLHNEIISRILNEMDGRTTYRAVTAKGVINAMKPEIEQMLKSREPVFAIETPKGQNLIFTAAAESLKAPETALKPVPFEAKPAKSSEINIGDKVVIPSGEEGIVKEIKNGEAYIKFTQETGGAREPIENLKLLKAQPQAKPEIKNMRILKEDTENGFIYEMLSGKNYIGSVEVWDIGKGKWKLENFYVKPKFRRKGVSTKIVEYISKDLNIPYKEFSWGLQTEEGAKLKKALDKRYKITERPQAQSSAETKPKGEVPPLIKLGFTPEEIDRLSVPSAIEIDKRQLRREQVKILPDGGFEVVKPKEGKIDTIIQQANKEVPELSYDKEYKERLAELKKEIEENPDDYPDKIKDLVENGILPDDEERILKEDFDQEKEKNFDKFRDKVMFAYQKNKKLKLTNPEEESFNIDYTGNSIYAKYTNNITGEEFTIRLSNHPRTDIQAQKYGYPDKEIIYENDRDDFIKKLKQFDETIDNMYAKTKSKLKPKEEVKPEKKTILRSSITTDGGEEIPAGKWEIISNTPKTIKLKLIKKSGWDNGLENSVNEKGEVIIKKDNTGEHHFEEWGDGSFTIYPEKGGTPHYFEPTTLPEEAPKEKIFKPIRELDSEWRTLQQTRDGKWKAEIGVYESKGETGGKIFTEFYDKKPTIEDIKRSIKKEYPDLQAIEEEKPKPKEEKKYSKIEPRYETMKEGDILVDEANQKYKIISIIKEGAPANWKYKIQNIENPDIKLSYPLAGIERYYKQLIPVEIIKKAKLKPSPKAEKPAELKEKVKARAEEIKKEAEAKAPAKEKKARIKKEKVKKVLTPEDAVQEKGIEILAQMPKNKADITPILNFVGINGDEIFYTTGKTIFRLHLPKNIGQGGFIFNPKLLKKINLDDIEILGKDKTKVGKMTFPSPTLDAFPELPKIEQFKEKDTFFEINPIILRDALKELLPVAGKNLSDETLENIYLKAENNELLMAATDAAILTHKSIPISVKKSFEYLLPPKTAKFLIKMLTSLSGAENITIGYSDKWLGIKFGGIEFLAWGYEGKFPNIASVIPDTVQDSKWAFLFPKKEITNVLNVLLKAAKAVGYKEDVPVFVDIDREKKEVILSTTLPAPTGAIKDIPTQIEWRFNLYPADYHLYAKDMAKIMMPKRTDNEEKLAFGASKLLALLSASPNDNFAFYGRENNESIIIQPIMDADIPEGGLKLETTKIEYKTSPVVSFDNLAHEQIELVKGRKSFVKYLAKIKNTNVSLEDLPTVDTPEVAADIFKSISHNPDVENSWILYLDKNKKIIGYQLVAIGGKTSATIIIERILRPLATNKKIKYIIEAHNHTGGITIPSDSDIKVDKIIRAALSSFFPNIIMPYSIVIDDTEFSIITPEFEKITKEHKYTLQLKKFPEFETQKKILSKKIIELTDSRDAAIFFKSLIKDPDNFSLIFTDADLRIKHITSMKKLNARQLGRDIIQNSPEGVFLRIPYGYSDFQNFEKAVTPFLQVLRLFSIEIVDFFDKDFKSIQGISKPLWDRLRLKEIKFAAPSREELLAQAKKGVHNKTALKLLFNKENLEDLTNRELANLIMWQDLEKAETVEKENTVIKKHLAKKKIEKVPAVDIDNLKNASEAMAVVADVILEMGKEDLEQVANPRVLYPIIRLLRMKKMGNKTMLNKLLKYFKTHWKETTLSKISLYTPTGRLRKEVTKGDIRRMVAETVKALKSIAIGQKIGRKLTMKELNLYHPPTAEFSKQETELANKIFGNIFPKRLSNASKIDVISRILTGENIEHHTEANQKKIIDFLIELDKANISPERKIIRFFKWNYYQSAKDNTELLNAYNKIETYMAEQLKKSIKKGKQIQLEGFYTDMSPLGAYFAKHGWGADEITTDIKVSLARIGQKFGFLNLFETTNIVNQADLIYDTFTKIIDQIYEGLKEFRFSGKEARKSINRVDDWFEMEYLAGIQEKGIKLNTEEEAIFEQHKKEFDKIPLTPLEEKYRDNIIKAMKEMSKYIRLTKFEDYVELRNAGLDSEKAAEESRLSDAPIERLEELYEKTKYPDFTFLDLLPEIEKETWGTIERGYIPRKGAFFSWFNKITGKMGDLPYAEERLKKITEGQWKEFSLPERLEKYVRAVLNNVYLKKSVNELQAKLAALNIATILPTIGQGARFMSDMSMWFSAIKGYSRPLDDFTKFTAAFTRLFYSGIVVKPYLWLRNMFQGIVMTPWKTPQFEALMKTPGKITKALFTRKKEMSETEKRIKKDLKDYFQLHISQFKEIKEYQFLLQRIYGEKGLIDKLTDFVSTIELYSLTDELNRKEVFYPSYVYAKKIINKWKSGKISLSKAIKSLPFQFFEPEEAIYYLSLMDKNPELAAREIAAWNTTHSQWNYKRYLRTPLEMSSRFPVLFNLFRWAGSLLQLYRRMIRALGRKNFLKGIGGGKVKNTIKILWALFLIFFVFMPLANYVIRKITRKKSKKYPAYHPVLSVLWTGGYVLPRLYNIAENGAKLTNDIISGDIKAMKYSKSKFLYSMMTTVTGTIPILGGVGRSTLESALNLRTWTDVLREKRPYYYRPMLDKILHAIFERQRQIAFSQAVWIYAAGYHKEAARMAKADRLNWLKVRNAGYELQKGMITLDLINKTGIHWEDFRRKNPKAAREMEHSFSIDWSAIDKTD